MSKALSTDIVRYVATTIIVERIYGIITDRKILPSVAPSILPASTISSGIAFIAAEKTTIANPVNIHTIIIINKIVLSGRFESRFKNVLPGSRFSNNGKFCKSLC